MPEDLLAQVVSRLDRIEDALASLARQRLTKDWYTTDEVARILARSPYTVRCWALEGRVRATKRGGRGRHGLWWIGREEVERIQNEGLLPARRGPA